MLPARHSALAETIAGLCTSEVTPWRGPWRFFAAAEVATLNLGGPERQRELGVQDARGSASG